VEEDETQPPVPSDAFGVYEKLDESKRQIRVLELHPGAREDPISGSLITVDLPPLPLDFDESGFVDELSEISNDIVFAVHSGSRVQEDEVDRWEHVHDSLMWLLAFRCVGSFGVLKDAHGTPAAEIVDQLKGFGMSSSSSLSEPALAVQRICGFLETTLSKCSAYHSWTHDLKGLTNRLFAQRTRSRHSIIHFAEQMDRAVIKFLSEDSDGMSSLTSVDVQGLKRFAGKVNLGNWLPFAAVSWFWGDAEHIEKMELDGNPLGIPFNAKCALRDLRNRLHSTRLWIDAVCINQDDKAERASQILLMSDIYSTASSTYVWLGNEDPVIQQAIYHLKLLSSLSLYFKDLGRARAGNTGPKDGPFDAPADHKSLSDVSNTTFNPVDWWKGQESASFTRSVDEILTRTYPRYIITRSQSQTILIPRLCQGTLPLFGLPWFSRLWVFQEAVLSIHCTIVFGSHTTFELNDLERGAYLICRHAGHDGSVSRGVDLTMRVLLQQGNLRSGSRLLKLVSESVDQECSDPRDYIFGLLGLTLWAKHRLRWPHLIQPNYVKSVSDCMRDATRVMIQQECSLEALLHWYQVGQSPTWAVHWHRHKQIRRRPVRSHQFKASELCSPDPRPLDLILMEECPDLNVLLLKGHSIDIVHSTTVLFGVDGDEAVKTSGLATLELALRRIMDLSIRTGFDFSPRAITLTFFACEPAHQPCSSETEKFHSLEYVVSYIWDELHGRRSKRCLDLPIIERYMSARFCGVFNHCELFSTRAGQLCVGPGGAQEGDKVVRLFGLRLPALLWVERSWFTFAGLACIDREFLAVHDTSTLPAEVFEIR
jgi:hypothetical protein